MPNVIGICGLIGSGKGTVADILVNTYGYTKISFADKLKDGVSVVFGWDRAMLEGDTEESRIWREQADPFWTNELKQTVSPRTVLQSFGTDCLRNGFYDGVWVSLVKKQILENPSEKFVIPDARFANEIGLITDLGGEVWWVRRGELPDWWQMAVDTNMCPEDEEYIIWDENKHMEQYTDIHQSEWRWARPDNFFAHIFDNNSTLESLQKQVQDAIT